MSHPIVDALTSGVTNSFSAVHGCVRACSGGVRQILARARRRPSSSPPRRRTPDQHPGGQPGPRHAAANEPRRGAAAPTAVSRVQPEAGDEQAHVLLDQQQRARGQRALPPPAGVVPLEHEHGRTGANAISWKSNATVSATGHASAYTATTQYAAARAEPPPRERPQRARSSAPGARPARRGASAARRGSSTAARARRGSARSGHRAR